MDYLNVKNDINVEKPEYSYIAHVLLDAYNVVARGRKYTQGVPLCISTADINEYLNIYELPIELDIFVSAIFMIDNEYIDEVREKMKNPTK